MWSSKAIFKPIKIYIEVEIISSPFVNFEKQFVLLLVPSLAKKIKWSYVTRISVISVNSLVTSTILKYSCRVKKKISDKFHLESPTISILLVIFAGMHIAF